MSLRTRFVASITAIKSTVLGAGRQTMRVAETAIFDMPDGSGAGQANVVYRADISIAASGQQSFDLTSLTNEEGDTFAFESVRALILIVAAAPDTDSAATLTPSGTLGLLASPLKASDCDAVFRRAGVEISSGNKTLTLAATGGTVTGVLTIVGT